MQKLVEKLGLSEGAASAVLWVGLSLLLLVVVAALALWLVRTLRPSLNINGGAGRGGRPQRLAVTDAFPLDRDGRKLVIVRRDNTEHLLLIGGPNDVLIEGNITRHDRSARGMARSGNEVEGDEPAAIPAPSASPPAPVAPPMAAPVPAPAPQQVVAPLRTDEFERALANQRPLTPPQPTPRPATPPAAMPPMAPPQPVAPQPVAMAPAPQPPPITPPMAPPPPAAPPVLTLEALLPEAKPVAVESPPPADPVPQETPAPRAPAMSEMARRLNEALQKPMSGTLRPPFNRSIPPAPPTAGISAPPVATPIAPPAPVAPVAAAPVAEAKVAVPEPEPVVAKADMDMLEEEMARLLGRPAQPKPLDSTKKPDVS